MITEFNKSTMVVLAIPVEGNYLFTIEDALAYIASRDKLYLLDDMMVCNVPIRDAIRSKGVRAVADELLQYAPDSEKLKVRMEGIVNNFKDARLADFDIQILPITAELQFFGKQVSFRQMGVDCKELVRRIGRWTSERERKDDTLHVAQLYEPYPCFDAEDFASETRSYDNYIICDHEITEEYCMEIENCFHKYDACFVVESLPQKYLPMVYHNGNSRFMLVATTKDNPQVTPEELTKRI